MTQSYAFLDTPSNLVVDLTNPSHFEQFVLTYSGVVQTVCLRLLKDPFAAEDACQETFAAAWRRRTDLRPNRAWLLKVATNKCLDELRWRSRHPTQDFDDHPDGEAALIVSGEPSPESALLSSCSIEVLEDALSRLPWAQRIAIVLSDVEGWSYREIAGACDISIGTVKSRIFRARRMLRQVLDDGRFFDE